MTLADIISYLDGVAPLIPIITFLFFRRITLLKELLPLFLYLMVLFFFNTLANVLGTYEITNYFVFHVSLPISFICILMFFHQCRNNIYFNEFWLRVGLVLLMLIVINTFTYERINTYNSLSAAVIAFYVIIICLRFFILLLQKDLSIDVLRYPFFWFMTGVLIYYSCSFILSSFYWLFFPSRNNNIQRWQQQINIIWQVNNMVVLIMCLLINKGILCKQYPTK
jgi:hypothetical protein